MKKILFGGAFDPIHLGHIHIAERASEQIDADVIFIPSKVSVWKIQSTSVEHKIKMLELSINDNPRFSIDRYEVDNGNQMTYSIETVTYFTKKYPNDTFYYLIGADHVNSFHKWRGAEEIAKMVQIIFYARPEYELNQENIKKFNMKQIVGELKSISSTDIRHLDSLELKKEVIDYIVTNNLYFVPKIHEFLREKRFNHSVSVANLAYQIAKKHNLDHPDKAYIAGLLHDIGKEIEQYPIMDEHYKEYLDLPKFAYHQFASEHIAKKEFEIEDPDILSAIRNHATGNKNMSTLDKIIYAADKIEPTRGFDSSELISAMMEDIDKGFKTVLAANKEFLIEHRGDIYNRLTSNCFKQYLD